MSALENETISDTTTFDHFGEEWTVPTKRHLSHIRKMRDEVRAGGSDYNLLAAETFLSAKQFDRLLEIDPDEDELNVFVGEIVKALGVKDKGNS